MPISEPSLERLPVSGQSAMWPRVWAMWFTEVWQQLIYNWHYPAKVVTADYAASRTDSIIIIDGDLTVTLPPIRTTGPKRMTFKVINAGAGNRVIDGGGANIDGAATFTITAQWDSIDVVTDGTEWFVV